MAFSQVYTSQINLPYPVVRIGHESHVIDANVWRYDIYSTNPKDLKFALTGGTSWHFLEWVSLDGIANRFILNRYSFYAQWHGDWCLGICRRDDHNDKINCAARVFLDNRDLAESLIFSPHGMICLIALSVDNHNQPGWHSTATKRRARSSRLASNDAAAAAGAMHHQLPPLKKKSESERRSKREKEIERLDR